MSANEQPVYEVRLRSRRVQLELDNLQESDHQRVVARIRALARDARPQGCEKLYDGVYRVRVGDIRIIYLTDDGNKRIEIGGPVARARELTRDLRNCSGELSFSRTRGYTLKLYIAVPSLVSRKLLYNGPVYAG